MYGLMAAASLALSAPSATVAPPSCTLSAPPAIYHPGDAVRLIWYTERAQSASITDLGPIPITEMPQGFRDVYPGQSALYTMTVGNQAGARSCSALVTVSLYQTPLVYPPYQLTQPISFAPTQIRYIPNTPLTYPVALPWSTGGSHSYDYSYEYSYDYSYDHLYDDYWYDPWLPDHYHYADDYYDFGYDEPYSLTRAFNGAFSGEWSPPAYYDFDY